MTTLLLDRDLDLTRYCGRLWPIFTVRTGILSPLERLPAGEELAYFHPDPTYERLAAAVVGARPLREIQPEELALAYLEGSSDELTSRFDEVVDGASLTADRLLGELGERLARDVGPVSEARGLQPLGAPPDGVFVVGDPARVLVHPEAEIFAGTVFDVREGPVVVDARAQVGQLSYVAGPSYVGPDSRVENARLVAPVVLGRGCRVGGEIEASVLGDFTNKHHEGFLGHSVVGRWVNIGALATTSDLKNNYGEVRLTLPSTFLPESGELASVATGRIKFGSIIGDCVKVAIGLRLDTGTVIDAGSNVFGESPPRYLPPFSWGAVASATNCRGSSPTAGRSSPVEAGSPRGPSAGSPPTSGSRSPARRAVPQVPDRGPLVCRAVLFDLDGVLVDSTEVIEDSWRRWARSRGVSEDELMPRIHGRPAMEVLRGVAPHLPAEREMAELVRQEVAAEARTRPYPGAARLLESLPAGGWAVVTSAPRSIAPGRLRRIGGGEPAVLVCADDVENGKPSPEGYLTAARRLGIEPTDCVVFEDSRPGVEAGVAAGMRVLALTTTTAAAELEIATVMAADISRVSATVEADGVIRLSVEG